MTEEPAVLKQQSAADLADVVVPEADGAFQLAPEDAPAALEALLYAAGDPQPIEKLQQITGLDFTMLRQILDALASRMARDRQRGLMLREIEGSFFLCTKPDMKDVLQRLFQPRHRPPLSQAAYETLAIIAYNQPVTRAQVEAVRGVNSDSIMARLVERNLIMETGHLETPGRPILYATTEQFLLDFGLRSVKDLPPMEMLMYGTLRDLETSLEEAAGNSRDRQMTIDQLVQAYIPGDEMAEQALTTEPTGSAEPKGETEPMDEETVIAVSGALFGEEDEQKRK